MTIASAPPDTAPRDEPPREAPGGQGGDRRIGRGRSAVVYLGADSSDRPMVRKVFVGEGLSKLVLMVLTGAANPYTWCEDAMATAVLRRRALDRLVQHWFGGRVRLPRTEGYGWNEDARAFQMRAEFVQGRHVPLRGPHSPEDGDPLGELMNGVMRPLQSHLMAAGFDGLVWQAGRGNPTATANFMLEEIGPGPARWVWIDLESGVPALFAWNPRATLTYYLPRSWRHRRWLFDDVDIDTLRSYLATHADALTESLGRDEVAELDELVDRLQARQDTWRALRRHQRGIGYELSQGRLTDEQARWWDGHPLLWSARVIAGTFARAAAKLPRLAGRLWRRVAGVQWGKLVSNSLRFAISQRHRRHIAHRFVGSRLRSWSARKFIDPTSAARLRKQLRGEDASVYLGDFAVHLGIKPLIKALQWWLFPLLYAAGVIDGATLSAVLVAGGAIGRTAYTLGRTVQAAWHRQRLPWVALLLGVFPVVGNVAYPAQLLYCGANEDDAPARFILYDAFAATGRAIPIWGGRDTRTEHGMNRLAHHLVRALSRG
ncbi:MAG: hypothetical protein ACYTCU_09760 [Planctomycetota bacterium]